MYFMMYNEEVIGESSSLQELVDIFETVTDQKFDPDDVDIYEGSLVEVEYKRTLTLVKKEQKNATRK